MGRLAAGCAYPTCFDPIYQLTFIPCRAGDSLLSSEYEEDSVVHQVGTCQAHGHSPFMRRIEPRIHLPSLSSRKRRCQSKFLRYFPQGFSDPQYEDLERGYKWRAHQRWETSLDPGSMRKLLAAGDYEQIAARAIAIEARRALELYRLEFPYKSAPGWDIYQDLLNHAKSIQTDLRGLRPRDMIDIQSFLWVQGSDEYP
jgi:hypothetical protein